MSRAAVAAVNLQGRNGDGDFDFETAGLRGQGGGQWGQWGRHFGTFIHNLNLLASLTCLHVLSHLIPSFSQLFSSLSLFLTFSSVIGRGLLWQQLFFPDTLPADRVPCPLRHNTGQLIEFIPKQTVTDGWTGGMTD